MNSFRAVAPTLVLSTLVACAPASDNAASTAALRQADSAYSAHMRTLDVAGLTALYANDAVMHPPNEPTVSGIEAVRTFAATFASVPGLTMSARLELVEVSASGDLGYTVNIVDMSTTDSLGATVTGRLRDVHVWKQDSAGQWKIVEDIWNSD